MRHDPDKTEKDLLCALKVIISTGEKAVFDIGTYGKSSFHRNFKKGWKQLKNYTE
jgi:hypothetical protein